jgi:hypothetical protein
MGIGPNDKQCVTSPSNTSLSASFTMAKVFCIVLEENDATLQLFWL